MIDTEIVCGRKVTYPSKKAARNARKRVQSSAGGTWIEYECASCGGWHLSRKDKAEEGEEPEILASADAYRRCTDPIYLQAQLEVILGEIKDIMLQLESPGEDTKRRKGWKERTTVRLRFRLKELHAIRARLIELLPDHCPNCGYHPGRRLTI